MCLLTKTDALDINLAIEQQKIRASLVGHRNGYAYLPELFHFTATLRISIYLVINRYFIQYIFTCHWFCISLNM